MNDEAKDEFKGKVVAYEPWNEGNIAVFGAQSTDQRASYQKAAFLGLRAGAGSADLHVCNNVLAGAGSNTTDALTAARLSASWSLRRPLLTA